MRPTTGAVLLLLWVLVLLPSANVHRFAGLPLSTLAEYLVLAALLPLVVSPALRRLYGRLLGRGAAWPRVGLFYASLVAAGVKVLLLVSGTHEGFLGCYRSPIAPPVTGHCEKSYENPWLRFGATRLDRSLDFGEGDWNLSFFNSLRFNFLPKVGGLSRDRLPIAVTWLGTHDAREMRAAEITYVGQGTVDLGLGPVRLMPHYASPATVVTRVPAGHHRIVIDYRFDDGFRFGQAQRAGPYATFRVRLAPDGRSGAPTTPFTPAPPSGASRALGALVDAVVIVCLLSVVCLYGTIVRPEWLTLLLVTLVGGGAYAWPESRWLSGRGLILALVCLLLVNVLARHRGRRLLVSYALVCYLSLLRLRLDVPDWRIVGYRGAGQDWLTYQSFARSILDTWSLEAGEPVFYMQPLYRYIAFTEHLLLGDGDGLIAAFALLALNMSVLVMYVMLFRQRRLRGLPLGLALTPGLLILLLINSATMVRFLEVGASEYPTWIALPLFLPMQLVARMPRQRLLGTALVGLSLVSRTNQAPALAAVFLIFWLSTFRRRPGSVMAASLLLVTIAMIPVLHNVYYGRRVAPLPASVGIPKNLVLHPSRLLQLGRDPGVAGFALSQIRGTVYLASFITRSGREARQLALAFHGLQLLWGLTALGVMLERRRFSTTAKLLVILPILYLGVHIFYQVDVYYPRHIVIGHFAMGVVAAYLLSPAARAERP
ncbi:MAG: hypothetical protein ACRELA_06855 [Candidatus Rokuibacteriota bacterium]